MPVKLIKACKDLNIGMSTAITFCHKNGYAIPTDPNARIDDDMYLMLADHFNPTAHGRLKGLQSVQSLRFSNFRKFEQFPQKDKDSLKLGGVTYFVGGNNAGKSTVVKAALLALENMKYIQFEGGNTLASVEVPFRFEGAGFHDVRVGDFETAINSKVNKDKNRRHEIVFELTLDKFHFEIHVVNSSDDKNRKEYDETSHVVVSKIVVTNTADNATFKVDLMARKVKFTGQTILNKDQEENKNLVHETISQLQKQLDEIQKRIDASESNAMEQATLYAQKDTLTQRLKLSITQLNNFADANAFTKTRDMNISISIPSNNALVKVIRGMSEDLSRKSGGSDEMKSQSVYVREMSKDVDAIISSIAVEYIPAHMAYQRTFFKMSDQDYMSQVISDYAHSRIRKGEREYLFVQKWLGRSQNALGQEMGLSICKDFKLIPIAGEAYQVDVTTMEDGQTRLADLGMGSIQMFILLLRFATILRKYSTAPSKPIIFVEEPELNLHPNWQSHLAELFRDLNSMGFQIVVETHSEYLIRKTQVLVANSDYKDQKDVDESCPFKVYYFSNEGCIDMKYQPSGRFVESFGTGFFDEAAKSTSEMSAKEIANRPKLEFTW